jgi:hypothetical protein
MVVGICQRMQAEISPVGQDPKVLTEPPSIFNTLQVRQTDHRDIERAMGIKRNSLCTYNLLNTPNMLLLTRKLNPHSAAGMVQSANISTHPLRTSVQADVVAVTSTHATAVCSASHKGMARITIGNHNNAVCC